MRKRMDDNLNLEQLLTRCKVLDSDILIRIYFDPDLCLFFICYVDELAFFLPPETSFLFECTPDGVRVEIEIFISRAVRLLNKYPHG